MVLKKAKNKFSEKSHCRCKRNKNERKEPERKIFMKKKVMLGMSGGVDSSVAALLLLQQGYDVTGVTMKLRPDEYMSDSLSGGCCSLDDIDDARRVAYKFGIDHMVLNFTDIFRTSVIDYFVEEYKCGRTPNPCIACNQYVKFEALLNKALTLGYDYVATGHYSVIEFDKNINRWLLKKAKCAKDQSYFLYNMTQFQLEHTLMPLANMEKTEARKIAAENDLPVASKPDSQEICFVENNDYATFIEKYTGKKDSVGDFVDESGNILGKHKGITKYTIGQRKGLGISFGEPMYVINIIPETNTVVLGKEGRQYSDSLLAEKLNFIPFELPTEKIRVKAKVRYQAKPADAILTPISKNKVKVDFDIPQRSVTKGQAVVFYLDDIVLGGGIII